MEYIKAFYVNPAQLVLKQAYVNSVDHINDIDRITHTLAQQEPRGKLDAQRLFEEMRVY